MKFRARKTGASNEYLQIVALSDPTDEATLYEVMTIPTGNFSTSKYTDFVIPFTEVVENSNHI
ncbi:hypothetical protein AB4865_09380 [Capnocytophaga sp. ARDL2]|uniref:hypothetical protein n=1 Tax=Capnocytophaga sp. ARDL2 TaxID=3238809 RepID=UPI003557610D